MRNLSLAHTFFANFPESRISSTAVDLEANVVYLTSQSEAAIGIWTLSLSEDAVEYSRPTLMTRFNAEFTSQEGPQIVSFRFMPDTRRLVIILLGGDILTVSLDTNEDEVEGTIEPGILSAQWSPDDELLAIITGEAKLILMTSTFDVLSEAPFHTTDFGEDAPINVGWGSKQTQFHGSLGKAAAQEKPTANFGPSPDDDATPRISWRGDGSYFAVSVLASPNETALRPRVLRVYDRQATLQATMEATAGLEHTLSWRPSGNLIVGTQRFGFEGGGAGKPNRHDVVFFERNGLRHGEFSLRLGGSRDEHSTRQWGYRVRELAWSSDSNVLAVWIEHNDGDSVQLWTTGNYHWYLKHEFVAPSSILGPGRFTSMSWHPERALCLQLTTDTTFIQRTYTWDTYSSSSRPPVDSGSVAVIDGSEILLTPFRMQNVPPPMASHRLATTGNPLSPGHTPIHAAFLSTKDALAVLWESGFVEVWDLKTRLEPGYGKVMDPSKLWSGTLEGCTGARQVTLQLGSNGSKLLVVLGSNENGFDEITTANITEGETTAPSVRHALGSAKGGRIVLSDKGIYWQSPAGEIIEVLEGGGPAAPLTTFSEFCISAQTIVGSEDDTSKIFVGFANPCKLFVASENNHILISSNVNSYTIASGYIIYATSAHEANFVPIKVLHGLLADANGGEVKFPEWERRRLERGSRIVVAVPSAMSLVLQMPRGNLETINPRPLVMEVVRLDVDALKYRKAFIACRKHRIDLSVLIEHDQAKFLTNLAVFLDQVHEVDHINLFLTAISRGSLPAEATSNVCDKVVDLLSAKDIRKYANSLLTAHVVKSPPDLEAALSLLPRLRSSSPELVEDAVKYVIFLVDADKLFDIALGMYDFSLVLMIAQHAQKDPREYLPFLRELRALESNYQHFKIDDHLKKYASALRNLSLGGDIYFDEATAYIEKHQLHETALDIWKNTDHHNTILELYGDWLFERREFHQAAAVFVEAGNLHKAMVGYERALEWQELFDSAFQVNTSEEDMKDTAYRVAEELSSKKRYAEAATVLVDYAQDIREAAIALVQGNLFAEAKRITSLHKRLDLVEDILHPGAMDSRTQLAEDVGEMREQLRKQLNRIHELRIKKQEEPDAFYGVEDSNLANVDVMTDVSMAPTTFTRYTVAPSMASKASKISSRSKRKAERKIGSGRKGTVDEEEYLLTSISKLVTRFQTTQREAQGLLPFLYQFPADHRQEGHALQKEVADFETELLSALDVIWAKPKENPDDPDPDTWASRMQEIERRKLIEPTAKITKPDLRKGDWRLRLLDVPGN